MKKNEFNHAILLNGSPRGGKGNPEILVEWVKNSIATNLRGKGNTEVLVELVKGAMVEKSWKVSNYGLYDLKFRGCSHCDACKKVDDKPGCVLIDDLSPILAQICTADLIIIASPVYCWSVSGCMSTALDRFYSLFKRDKSLIAGKKILGIFSSGGDAFHGMDLCVEMLTRLADYGKAQYVGSVTATNCETPQKLLARARLKQEVDNLLAKL